MRVHTGDRASESARRLGAKAYTIGNDIVLGTDYDAASASGRRLMAHELAHVTQQQRRPGPPMVYRDAADHPDHFKAHPRVVDVEDLPPVPKRDLQRGTPNLPSGSGMIVMVDDRDRHQTHSLRLEQVTLSPEYVDSGLVSVRPRGDVWTLEIFDLTFMYSGGASLTVPWGAIRFEPRPTATNYLRVSGRIFPLSAGGALTFDAENTPHIVIAAAMVWELVRKASQKRVQIAQVVDVFAKIWAINVAALGATSGVISAVDEINATARAGQPAARSEEEEEEIDRSFAETFSEEADELPAAGATTVAPEVAAGFSPAQVRAAGALLSRPIGNLSPLRAVWRRVAIPGQAATLTLQNSRRLFNNQRGRFWRAVRADPAARALFEDAGFEFRGRNTTAPTKRLASGALMQATIDHIVERQTNPGLALDEGNLRVVTRLENTVVLRQVTGQDPFQ